ncbi:hypothetical protein [Aquimarina hainanensis]|uniref:hypothetical protein n=1 Tax=Aquimarina hainanensis TaxID=1578017 RepID=UPI00361B6065
MITLEMNKNTVYFITKTYPKSKSLVGYTSYASFIMDHVSMLYLGKNLYESKKIKSCLKRF